MLGISPVRTIACAIGQPSQRAFLRGEHIGSEPKVRGEPGAELLRMYVLRAKHERHDDRALGGERPVFDHQEAIDNAWDGNACESGAVEKQPGDATLAAECNRARDEIN